MASNEALIAQIKAIIRNKSSTVSDNSQESPPIENLPHDYDGGVDNCHRCGKHYSFTDKYCVGK